MDNLAPLNPHVIRFYSKKETEYFEIGGKRITRPSLTGSIPSCCTSRSPLVIKGDNLKPIPGMSKMITIQFIQESTKEMINITNPLEMNMCCDKCLTVIAPEVTQNTVYHVRIGFNCRKIEKAIISEKDNLKLDNFIVDQHHHHQHHASSAGMGGNGNQHNIITIDNRDSGGVLDILHHHIHVDQAQQNQINNNVNNHHSSSNSSGSSGGHHHHGHHHHHHHHHHQHHSTGLDSDEISPETETLVQISEDSMQIDPKHIAEQSSHENITDIDHTSGNSSTSNINTQNILPEISNDEDEVLPVVQSEINPFIFETDEHILWSNEIVVAIDVGNSRTTPPNTTSSSILGKRNASNMTNPIHSNSSNGGSRKKKSKTNRNSSNINDSSDRINNNSDVGSSNHSNIAILSSEVIQQLMNGDIEMIKNTLEMRSFDNKIYYDLERRDEDGFTPLHYSCAYGMNGLVEYLLKSDVDPNRADKEGWTPLHWSVKANNLVAIHLLLAYGADQSVPNNSNQYPVEMAFDKGFTLIAATLQGLSEQEYKKNNEPLILIRENTHNQNYQNLIDNSSLNNINNNNINNNNNIQVLNNNNNNNNNLSLSLLNNVNDNNNDNETNLNSIAGNYSNELKLMAKHGLEPYIPPITYTIKSGVIEKHNTLKFIQAAEKLGLTPQHRNYLMDAFKSLRTLRYRLFWIMLTKPIFSKICEWDSNGIDFLVHNKDTLLAVLGLYFGLRGSNSAIDWMSHLARRKCNKSSGTGNGDIWTNLRATTFNLQTNLDELKDITSEKGEKRKSLTNKDSPLTLSIEEASQNSVDISDNNNNNNNSNNNNNNNNSNNKDSQISNIVLPQPNISGSQNNSNNHPIVNSDLLLVSNEHVAESHIGLQDHNIEEIHHHPDEHIHHHHHEHHVHLEENHSPQSHQINQSNNVSSLNQQSQDIEVDDIEA